MHQQQVTPVEQDLLPVFRFGEIQLRRRSPSRQQRAAKNSAKEVLHASDHVPGRAGLEVFF